MQINHIKQLIETKYSDIIIRANRFERIAKKEIKNKTEQNRRITLCLNSIIGTVHLERYKKKNYNGKNWLNLFWLMEVKYGIHGVSSEKERSMDAENRLFWKFDTGRRYIYVYVCRPM